MTRTAAEVEDEVVAQRDQLDRTVEALKDKMTPGQLFDEATHAMGGAGQQLLSKFVEQAKENPMPLAVMGLGLAWLMSSSPKASPGAAYRSYGASAATYQQASGGGGEGDGAHHNGIGEAVHSIAGNAADALSDARQKASDIVGNASDALSDAAASAGRMGQSAASGMRAAVHGASERASSIGTDAQKRATDLFQREPLIIGALGLAIGVALGAALPATPAEDHLLGPMHDRVVDKGADLAKQTLAQAGVAGKAALDALGSELADADIPGAVHNVAHAGVQSVKDALQSG